jgi:hypothetical protein
MGRFFDGIAHFPEPDSKEHLNVCMLQQGLIMKDLGTYIILLI